VQMAYADAVTRDPDCAGVTAFYQRKRDLFLSLVRDSRFIPLSSQGTFFQLLDYSAISTERDEAFAVWMTRTHGVASIPLTPFLHGGEQAGLAVRFCFAKRDETLERAAERLRAI
jgi:methionine aminotransferase